MMSIPMQDKGTIPCDFVRISSCNKYFAEYSLAQIACSCADRTSQANISAAYNNRVPCYWKLWVQAISIVFKVANFRWHCLPKNMTGAVSRELTTLISMSRVSLTLKEGNVGRDVLKTRPMEVRWLQWRQYSILHMRGPLQSGSDGTCRLHTEEILPHEKETDSDYLTSQRLSRSSQQEPVNSARRQRALKIHRLSKFTCSKSLLLSCADCQRDSEMWLFCLIWQAATSDSENKFCLPWCS